MTKKQRRLLIKILTASAILFVLQLIPAKCFNTLDNYLFENAGKLIRAVFYMLDYLIIGYDILRKAFGGITNGRIFDENFLMTVATIGAFVLAVYKNGDYIEAIAVMLFYQIGEWFQSYAVGKSRRNISSLMDIRPDHANIETDGKLIVISPEEVAVGTVITVQTGEKIPIDGVIVEGSSDLNTSSLTGEAMPRYVSVGDTVISGCINMSGALKIKTTKEFSDSTVSKILDLVENASSKKSKSENFISKFARIYTPAVCFSALALALLPPIIRILFTDLGAAWGVWIYRALTFLVISCPCALVISIPLSFFAGIGGAGRAGILIKGSAFLETLSKTKYVVFAKTGTITKGVFEVSEITSLIEKDRLLEYAALAESYSSHPISKSIKNAYGKEIDRALVSDVTEISGLGVTATVSGMSVAIGNSRLMADMNIACEAYNGIGTAVYVAIDGDYVGRIVISDTVKANSAEAISKLKKAGIQKTVILTGDTKESAEEASQTLGIDCVYSNLLPTDKVTVVEKLLSEKTGKSKLVFVGDGINDAPVLSRADIGIAMGELGSDAAIEAADIVIMDDDPLKIPLAIGISKKTVRIVYQNIFFSLSVKFVCLLLGALGIANMYLAIFADVGVMVLAVLNAIRALFVKKHI